LEEFITGRLGSSCKSSEFIGTCMQCVTQFIQLSRTTFI